MTDIIKAIKLINPNAEVFIIDENIDNIKWLNGTTPISKEDIEAQFPQVELEMTMSNLRAKRNKLIAETDYLALSDNTLSEAMSTYRQSLRDITNGITTIEQANSVTWPTKP
jgi:hypothetical protein